jgi:excisionase family DNA binding protein
MLIANEDQLRELFKNFAEVYSINIQSQIESAVEASLSNKNMTVKECSEYLRQCDLTTRKMILDNRIKAVRVGNKYLIPKKQFTYENKALKIKADAKLRG